MIASSQCNGKVGLSNSEILLANYLLVYIQDIYKVEERGRPSGQYTVHHCTLIVKTCLLLSVYSEMSVYHSGVDGVLSVPCIYTYMWEGAILTVSFVSLFDAVLKC